MIIYVTGGARSGKSQLAEQKLAAFEGIKAYIATAIAFDDGMKDRIKKHQAQRPSDWATIERYKDFQSLASNKDFLEAKSLIFDCATVMITNLMMDSGLDFDTISRSEIDHLESQIKAEMETLIKVIRGHDKNLVIVSNEVGMGLVPPYRMGNIFRDIQGRINQYLGQEADEVYFAVSGLPMKLK